MAAGLLLSGWRHRAPVRTMATFPYFVFSPNSVLSIVGLLRGPDTTTPTPAEDWRQAKVDVIIPALNEQDNIALCLASVMRQTQRPRRILLVDDGSSDRTVAVARAFCAFHDVELTAIQRRSPIGKTPTIKRQARELDSDVEFVLDADTVLESDNYIERTVQELYQAVGIACACGTILPLRKGDRAVVEATDLVQAFRHGSDWPGPPPARGWLAGFATGVTHLYREVLYLFLQRFIYRGQMEFFGTIANPVGCAVAYRRKYVQALFELVGPTLGDDLTNSEDIFIGLAMLNEGYRNVQLRDVYARTVEPHPRRLPRQIYLWSSSFLQCCYYFDGLLRSPFKIHKRWRLRREAAGTHAAVSPRPVMSAAHAYSGASGRLAGAAPALASPPAIGPTAIERRATALEDDRPGPAGRRLSDDAAGPETASRSRWGRDRRRIQEPYRQAFGRAHTLEYGRPAGWLLMSGAVEKVFFPTILLIMVLTGNWYGVALTVAFETAASVFALVLVTKGHRFEYLLKGLAVAPIRYVLLGSDLVTIGRFASDLWLTKNRKWRK